MKLRVPAVLAFTVLGAAGVATLAATSCSDDKPVIHDAGVRDATADSMQECQLFCIPDGTDAGTVCESCADAGNCPSGCRPVG